MGYTQDGRPIKITSPLGDGDLFVTGISGHEAISQLFGFRLELQAPSTGTIDFSTLLGQPIGIEIVSPILDGTGASRYFHGMCSRLGQGTRTVDFTSFWMEIVPKVWLLSRSAESRIFQQKTAVDIIKAVLTGYTVDYAGITGSFKTRDYCVQYRETDFNFACRLMEEEGIYYYFKHAQGSHTMVLANTPNGHSAVDGTSTIYFSQDVDAQIGAGVITGWQKTQELRSGKYTLWDYSFEKPTDNFSASQPILASVSVGSASHELKLSGVNDSLELYDFPGEYAQRFDGIDPGGGDRASDVSNIADDKTRVVGIRMQEEASASVLIEGVGNVQSFQAGRKFTFTGHFDGDDDYVLTSVQHDGRLLGGFDSGSPGGFSYSSSFSCVPFALPYRPKRTTPKPVIHGTQSAVVVGPSGTEIFTDKYSRVKVQFHWDRDGTNDANSSCWIRVGTIWAGKQWGVIHIPRVGQEVIVAFEEGDPDQPIIVGSVYNADNMPPYTLPDNRTQSGIVSRSSLNGSAENFNSLRFEDKKDSEDIYFHAEKDFHREVEHDDDLIVLHDQTISIKNNRTEEVKEGDETVTITKGNRLVTVKQGDDSHIVKTGNRIVTVETGDDTHTVKTGNRVTTVSTGNDTHTVKTGNRSTEVSTGNDALAVKLGNQSTKVDVGAITADAMQGITLTVGQNSIKIDQTGITIKGLMISIQGSVQTEVKGLMVSVAADAMLQAKGAITMIG